MIKLTYILRNILFVRTAVGEITSMKCAFLRFRDEDKYDGRKYVYFVPSLLFFSSRKYV